jgi:RNA polymerase sigma-70 factor (ECF subfamily)
MAYKMLFTLTSLPTVLLFMSKNNVLKFPVDSFAHLINQHRSELNHFIARKLGTAEISDDILQDAYLRLQHYPTLANIDNPRAFVFRIVTNLVIDYQRCCSNRMPHNSDEEVLHAIAANESEPDKHCLALQRLAIINAALEELPVKCRRAFYLNRVEGYTHAEIAEQLQISKSMVAKHVFRAVIHCREYLKNQ